MLFRRPQFFPKQLFFRFVVLQVLGVIPVLLLIGAVARLHLGSRVSALTTPDAVMAAYDNTLLLLAAVMCLLITGVAVWSGFRFVLPLGRILVKARSILKRDYATLPREENSLSEDELGEWSDLDSALHRIGRDMQIKDRYLSQEREEIEAIIGAISEAVVAIDNSGNLLFYNSQFIVLFGDLHRGHSRLSDYFRNPDVLDAFRSTLKEGKPVSVSTRLRLRGEVELRHFSLSVAPLRMEENSIYGAVGVFHDVTELKRMDQVRIDFVANVSHELRTPLTSIKGYAQTLKEEFPANSPSGQYLATIERNTDRLIALVQDLLSLSSLESGGDLRKEEVNLKELTERVANQLKALREQKGHELDVQVDVPTLWADPKRLEQVVFNLLENAIKYVPNGGKIQLAWERIGTEICLRVRDNGPGIPLEHHGRIFERFYRVDSARTREQGGTGLGLSIVKHIVQRHGGKVKVQGAPGHGTEFVCTFPAEGER